MSTFFKNFVDEIKDEDTNIAADGKSAAEFSGWIDTGCYILNAQLSGTIYGGVPNNKITAFAGESGTGKSFLVLGVVKTFLRNNPDAFVVYYDTEAAITKDMMESRGIDTTRVVISEPATIQQFRTKALKVLNAYIKTEENKRPPMMMVLDSLGMLSSDKELTDTAEGKDTRDMTKAQLIRATFRVLTLKLAKAKVPMLLTAHTYQSVGAYIPTSVVSGGGGLIYAASTIIMLSSKKDRDNEKHIVGNIIVMEQSKGRLAKRYSKVEAKLSYDTGLDQYYGLLDLAEKHGVIKKVSTRYEMPDGTKVFGKNINEEPEKYFTKEILELIDDAAKKEFLYGTTDDQIESEVE